MTNQVITIAGAAHIAGIGTEAVRKAIRAEKLGSHWTVSFDGVKVTLLDFTAVCNYWHFMSPTSPLLDDVMRERIIIRKWVDRGEKIYTTGGHWRSSGEWVELEVLSAKPILEVRG